MSEEIGLREAAYEYVAWSVVEVGPGIYQCRVCQADVTDPKAPHEDDCPSDALWRALAASHPTSPTERPAAQPAEETP